MISLKLHPIYWRMNAPPIRVLRATWFYDPVSNYLLEASSLLDFHLLCLQKNPLSFDLAANLEQSYLKVKPWTTSYALELSTAREIGLEGYGKLKQPLDTQYSVLFEDESRAYLIR